MLHHGDEVLILTPLLFVATLRGQRHLKCGMTVVQGPLKKLDQLKVEWKHDLKDSISTK